MTRYVISLLVFLAGIGFTVLTTGGSFLFLLDLPSFIAVGIVPFLFASVLFGFKNTAAAFSTALKKEAAPEQLRKAENFFKSYGKITWIAAVIGVMLGLIGMLANLEDKSQIDPNLALASFSLLYGGIINAAVILPFTILVKKQLADKG